MNTFYNEPSVMSIDQISAIFNFFQISVLFKLFLLVGGLFYFVFTVIVFRQIQLMTQILDSKISPIIKTLALSQIILATVLFFLIVIFA